MIGSSSGKAAEILIGTKELTLTSGVPSVNTTLAGGYHEINLTNVVGSNALIIIDDGTEGNLEEKRVGRIGDLQFYISSLDGTSSGANVEFFVGEKYLFLYGTNPEDVKTIDSVEYLFVVSSSDSSGAIIEVQKCGGGSFTEVSDSVEPEEDDSEINDSLSQNESLSEEDINDSLVGSENLQDKSFSRTIYIVIITIVIVIVVSIALFIFYKLSRKNNGEVSS